LSLQNQAQVLGHILLLGRWLLLLEDSFVLNKLIFAMIYLYVALIFEQLLVTLDDGQVVVAHDGLEGWQRDQTVRTKDNVSVLAFILQSVD
jgi:hypothetical protein